MMSYDDVARADRNYEYFVGDLWTLMHNAGARVAEYISASQGDGKKVLVVAGNGNNGGDGIVAGTLLSGKNTVSLFSISGPHGMKTRDSRHAMRDYRGRFMDMQSFMEEASSYHVIIDAIFGSGFSGEPRPPQRPSGSRRILWIWQTQLHFQRWAPDLRYAGIPRYVVS